MMENKDQEVNNIRELMTMSKTFPPDAPHSPQKTTHPLW